MKYFYYLFLTLFMILSLTNCGERRVKDIKINKKVNINPEYALFPPIPTSVVLSKAEDKNENKFLIESDFNGAGLTEPYHAILFENEKIILRDDGIGGDKTKNDHIYSANFLIDRNSLDILQSKWTDVNEYVTYENRLRQIKSKSNPITKIKDKIIIQNDIVTSQVMDGDSMTLSFLKTNSILITDLSVVEDPERTYNKCTGKGNPDGVWTFKTLMTKIANTSQTGISASQFVMNWLKTWENTHTINNQLLNKRFIKKILDDWIKKSKLANPQSNELDLSIAPFKLTAIVNRIDLRKNIGYTISEGGELRFTFNYINPKCQSETFNVILEFGVPASGCSSVQEYAEKWYNLKNYNIASAEYRRSLQSITDFVTAPNAAPKKPNGSALNQIRTNQNFIIEEFISGSIFWEFREFKIDNETHLLRPVTVKQTPNIALPDFWTFVTQNEPSIRKDNYTIPENLLRGQDDMTFPFSNTGTAQWFGEAPGSPNYIQQPATRHFLAINTCSGCHGTKETNNSSGMHIRASNYGSVSELSDFITGKNMPVKDPVRAGVSWHFNEIERRAIDLQNLVEQPCFLQALFFKTPHFVH